MSCSVMRPVGESPRCDELALYPAIGGTTVVQRLLDQGVFVWKDGLDADAIEPVDGLVEIMHVLPMRLHLISIVVLTLSLSGCGTINTGLRNIQLNDAAIPLSLNYKEMATKAVGDHQTDGSLLVSEPVQIPGVGIFDPKRWVVCVRGLSPPQSKPTSDLSNMHDQSVATGVYEAIIVFYKDRVGKPKMVFDAPLCQHLTFEVAPKNWNYG